MHGKQHLPLLSIRSAAIDGQAWVVAADLCRALGVSINQTGKLFPGMVSKVKDEDGKMALAVNAAGILALARVRMMRAGSGAPPMLGSTFLDADGQEIDRAPLEVKVVAWGALAVVAWAGVALNKDSPAETQQISEGVSDQPAP
jgi:hypothetical protein